MYNYKHIVRLLCNHKTIDTMKNVTVFTAEEVQEAKYNDLRSLAKEYGISLGRGAKKEEYQAALMNLLPSEKEEKKAKEELELVPVKTLDAGTLFRFPSSKNAYKVAEVAEDGEQRKVENTATGKGYWMRHSKELNRNVAVL